MVVCVVVGLVDVVNDVVGVVVLELVGVVVVVGVDVKEVVAVVVADVVGVDMWHDPKLPSVCESIAPFKILAINEQLCCPVLTDRNPPSWHCSRVSIVPRVYADTSLPSADSVRSASHCCVSTSSCAPSNS